MVPVACGVCMAFLRPGRRMAGGTAGRNWNDAAAIRSAFGSVPCGETVPCAAVGMTGADLACLDAESLEGLTLAPGGMPFGVRFLTDGVTVVGFCDIEQNGKKVNPAAAAGLKLRDTILRVGGEPLIGADGPDLALRRKRVGAALPAQRRGD